MHFFCFLFFLSSGWINIYIILHSFLLSPFKKLLEFKFFSHFFFTSQRARSVSLFTEKRERQKNFKCKNILPVSSLASVKIYIITQTAHRERISPSALYMVCTNDPISLTRLTFLSSVDPVAVDDFRCWRSEKRCKKVSNDKLWLHHNRKFSSISCYAISFGSHEFSATPNFFKLPSAVGSPGCRLSALL